MREDAYIENMICALTPRVGMLSARSEAPKPIQENLDPVVFHALARGASSWAAKLEDMTRSAARLARVLGNNTQAVQSEDGYARVWELQGGPWDGVEMVVEAQAVEGRPFDPAQVTTSVVFIIDEGILRALGETTRSKVVEVLTAAYQTTSENGVRYAEGLDIPGERTSLEAMVHVLSEVLERSPLAETYNYRVASARSELEALLG